MIMTVLLQYFLMGEYRNNKGKSGFFLSQTDMDYVQDSEWHNEHYPQESF